MVSFVVKRNYETNNEQYIFYSSYLSAPIMQGLKLHICISHMLPQFSLCDLKNIWQHFCECTSFLLYNLFLFL